jgi:hypothetical protein
VAFARHSSISSGRHYSCPSESSNAHSGSDPSFRVDRNSNPKDQGVEMLEAIIIIVVLSLSLPILLFVGFSAIVYKGQSDTEADFYSTFDKDELGE